MQDAQSDTTATIEERIGRLRDEQEVRETFLQFFALLDARRYPEVAELLTPDVEIDHPVPERRLLRGREDVTAHLRTRVAPWTQTSAHVVGEGVVEWDGERPRVVSYVTAWYWHTGNTRLGDLRPADWTAVWLVESDFTRVDGRWLIAWSAASPAGGLVAAGEAPFVP
ncbi:nuclear transport factor 2 family protein [Actinocorallia sp. API 0066]|uniref:nuclear transport factor 2 family protein n=1 Tax=Actinocorallia sp. API 0066 TaxID=2896846 RepID=UPI001E4FE6A1|nr:nuclear transport factor 2 family protein [Actinocorallia sp. API 0066]MCD0450919.1 nuclear transport factor 2 family protein [Actinocorallia sp. API 0066]